MKKIDKKKADRKFNDSVEKNKLLHSKVKNGISNFLFLVFVVLCVLFLWKVQADLVDGQSMEPTLANGDRIFVIKNVEPERYDLVTFRPLDKPKESYVKRIIGLPGDVIWTKENNLYLNHQLKKIPSQEVLKDLSETELPDGTIKLSISASVRSELEGYITIPKNHYFVLGDNRNHSTDSRVLGLVRQEQLQGTVLFRYFPFSKMGFVN